MFWADEIAASAIGPQVVNDSKTPSGTVHVGSLRGPVVVDTIARALRSASVPVELRYGVDDLDPMDAQALLTPDAIERSMGVPLAHVPDPPATAIRRTPVTSPVRSSTPSTGSASAPTPTTG